MMIPVIACFYAVVALHYQIQIYLYHTLPMVFLGLSVLSSRKWLIGILAVFMCSVGLYFHAAQPINRGLEGIVGGQRVALTSAQGRLPRVNLFVEERDIRLYTDILKLIEENTAPGEKIFVVPFNPELYFLSGRTNPFSFIIFWQGIQNQAQYEKFLDEFKRKKPKLIINNVNDKRHTIYTRKLLEYLPQSGYREIQQIGNFQFLKI